MITSPQRDLGISNKNIYKFNFKDLKYKRYKISCQRITMNHS